MLNSTMKPQRLMTVQGSLEPLQPENVPDDVMALVQSAFVSESLVFLLTNTTGEDGFIEIDAAEDASRLYDENVGTTFGKRSAVTDYEKVEEVVRNTAYCFTEVLFMAEIKELALTGSLMITVQTDEQPVIARVNVEKGAMSLQWGYVCWGDNEDYNY